MMRWLGTGVVTLLLASPAAALAQTASAPGPSSAAAPQVAGEDEVSLKNGGMLRGTVVAVEPGKEVILLVPGTGEQRRIPWAEVDQVQRGKYAPSAAPAPAAPPPAAAPAPPPAAPPDLPAAPKRGAPRVHIATDDPAVSLHQVTMTIGVVGAGGSAYGVVSRPICQAPCDRVVDGTAGQQFFFAGEGITPSSPFRLSDKAGDVSIAVDAGSAGKRFGGIMLSSVGAAGVVGGGMLLLLDGLGPKGSQESSFLPTLGGVALGAGAVMLVPGIILWATSGTDYSFQDAVARTRTLRF
ncbi:uncharacterized protein SOCE26_001420 [Sorangium cellulosum]|uniref:Uncharacterized protein n=1 Tax=Sorangium cellulosum TaxID=56 RepID=A0A2L0EHI6_SORCE|nr:hypothetical protein [Sorangium cellulosum]AUX38764.1 uncharacterized protein SOCE26_001420 [Sorangium cellulosum]